MFDYKLSEIKRKYKANFKMLLKTQGTKEQSRYAKTERRLNGQQVARLKELGIYIPDPCPILSSISCGICTGYYKPEKHGKRTIYKQATPGTEGAELCFLKPRPIQEEGDEKEEQWA